MTPRPFYGPIARVSDRRVRVADGSDGIPDPASDEPAAIPLPTELPELPANPRVRLLIDGDCLSRGLVEGTTRGRASDREVRSCLDRVRATATLLDPHARSRCAVSSATAIHHLDVLTSAPSNLFTIRRGLNGADRALLEELTDVIDARVIATTRRPGRQPTGPVDLVLLVGQDGIYAQPLRRLRLLGVSGWVLTPGHLVAASLRRAACAVTYIGPRSPA